MKNDGDSDDGESRDHCIMVGYLYNTSQLDDVSDFFCDNLGDVVGDYDSYNRQMLILNHYMLYTIYYITIIITILYVAEI